ncbi:MAG: sigma-70 family RNA polymerase sigma factor [Gorillibacterium sp.]|nr:sigma-70 family RNA polymerase sigma factor [Gorillibacterium sp.]
MQEISLRPSDRFTEKYHAYGTMLFRIAMVYLGNKADAEEAVQETFMKLLYKAPVFHELEHEKAWLIRVITNICKNMLRSIWHKRVVKQENIEMYGDTATEKQVVEQVISLPFKYKTVIHLYYYEDYSIRQIAQTLQISESAVKMRLQRGRQLLKFEMEATQDE